MYFLFGSSTQLPIQFLGWDYILPGFYIITYFGWNMAQIFFLKTSFEDMSLKANRKILPEVRSNKNKYISVLFLILAISIPIITQSGTFFAFNQFFEPQAPSDPIAPLWWFYGWNIAMFGVILVISYRLFSLFIKSKKNDTLNVFSSIFYVLIWLIIWFRSFSFINSFRSVTQVTGIDAFRVVIDVFLMVFTAILVIKGLGTKTYKIRLFNPNNLAFFLFAFTMIYMEGQIVMITGAGSISGTYTNRSQVNLVNNFLVLLITLVFYWYYAEYSLKKNGLILKKIFNQEEVIIIVSDFKDYLVNSGALDSNRISDSEFQNFLQEKKLKIKDLDIHKTEKFND